MIYTRAMIADFVVAHFYIFGPLIFFGVLAIIVRLFSDTGAR